MIGHGVVYGRLSKRHGMCVPGRNHGQEMGGGDKGGARRGEGRGEQTIMLLLLLLLQLKLVELEEEQGRVCWGGYLSQNEFGKGEAIIKRD